MGGGGSSGAVTETGVPDWARPYIEGSLAEAERLYESGELAKVAGQPTQGLEAQEELAKAAMTGTGLYDIDEAARRQMQNLAGSAVGQAGLGGTLGTARSERAMQSALADQALQFQQAKQQSAAAGAAALRDVDAARQQQRQAELDVPYAGLQRVFGFYGSPAVGQTQTQTQGGGK